MLQAEMMEMQKNEVTVIDFISFFLSVHLQTMDSAAS